jgi:hypothetical protein
LTVTERSKATEIKQSGSQPSTKGPAEYFSGNVRIDPEKVYKPDIVNSAGKLYKKPGYDPLR